LQADFANCVIPSILIVMASCASEHPKIGSGAIFGGDVISFEEGDEVVNGETLAAVLATGPMPVCRLLDIATQTAALLASRHEKGLAHGCLTAEEIVLLRDGCIHLARSCCPPESSPQQDQWALGGILAAAFERSAERSSTSEQLQWLIERLLAEKPEERYVSTYDLYVDLRRIRDRLPQAGVFAPVAKAKMEGSVRSRPPFMAIPLTLLVCIIFGLCLWKGSASPAGVQEEIHSSPVWSFDGSKILFIKRVAGVDQVFVQAFGSAEAVQLTHAARPSINPRWSPDGNAIAFRRGRQWWTGPLTPDRQKEVPAAPVLPVEMSWLKR
jgi:hypothetical protein